MQSTVFAIAPSGGYSVALSLLALVRERTDLAIPIFFENEMAVAVGSAETWQDTHALLVAEGRLSELLYE